MSPFQVDENDCYLCQLIIFAIKFELPISNTVRHPGSPNIIPFFQIVDINSNINLPTTAPK